MAKVNATQPQPHVTTTDTAAVEQTHVSHAATIIEEDSTSHVPASTAGGVQPDALDKPKFDAESAIAMLQQVMAMLNTEQTNKEVESTRAAGLEKKQVREQATEMLEKAGKAIEEAKKKGVLSQIFGWIGVAVAIVATVASVVATIATAGGSAAAVGLAVAGCVAAITGAALATATQVVMSIPELMENMSPTDKNIFMYTMMALQIACAILSVGAGAASSAVSVGKAGGQVASSAAKVGSELADDALGLVDDAAGLVDDAVNVADDVANVASKATTTAQKVQKQAVGLESLLKVAGGGNEIAEGAVNISAAESRHEAEHSRATAADFKAILVRLGWEEESAREFVESLVEFMDAGMQVVAEVHRDAQESRAKISQNV